MRGPRLRRVLLVLYLLAAFGDATAKAFVASPAGNAFVRHLVHGHRAEQAVRRDNRPHGNFEIFRAASRHLVTGQDLYAAYPGEVTDRFKYSPTFALLFAPLAWLPWPLALFLWSALNALALFVAVELLLPEREALVVQGAVLLEVLRAMQNAQSNALVAAFIILAFAALERGRYWRAAGAVTVGACVKIFPLAALTFAIPRRRVLRTGFAAACAGVLLLAAPLLVATPTALLAQYHSWQGVEQVDAQQRWFSVMELLHRWFGVSWPNWPVQLAGVLLLLLPLAFRRERWTEHRFRLLYLCSVLLFVVLFNHQAERASYVIAFTGAAIWFASETRTWWRSALFAIAFITVPLMSTLIPRAPNSPTAMLYRLAVPMLAIWLVVQGELWRRSRSAPGGNDTLGRGHPAGRNGLSGSAVSAAWSALARGSADPDTRCARAG